MKVENFFKEFVLIKNHLFSFSSNFGKKQGFLDLLKYVHSKNLLPKDVLIDIAFIWKTRNKMISSHSDEREISNEIIDKLTRIKQKLGI